MPRPAEDGAEDDGDAEDAEADGEDPAVTAELGAPGDREESGAVVPPRADAEGVSVFPRGRTARRAPATGPEC